jgi:hypothetical protein
MLEFFQNFEIRSKIKSIHILIFGQNLKIANFEIFWKIKICSNFNFCSQNIKFTEICSDLIMIEFLKNEKKQKK